MKRALMVATLVGVIGFVAPGAQAAKPICPAVTKACTGTTVGSVRSSRGWASMLGLRLHGFTYRPTSD